MVVPVLRAGLGMLGPACCACCPTAHTGFIGVARNEATLEPEPYMNSVPDDLGGRDVLVLDPMLATGGSLDLRLRHARATATPAASRRCASWPPPRASRALAGTGLADALVTASIDDHLNDDAFIVPGLGDAGDRLYGTA